jgi:hypothetical protein
MFTTKFLNPKSFKPQNFTHLPSNNYERIKVNDVIHQHMSLKKSGHSNNWIIYQFLLYITKRLWNLVNLIKILSTSVQNLYFIRESHAIKGNFLYPLNSCSYFFFINHIKLRENDKFYISFMSMVENASESIFLLLITPISGLNFSYFDCDHEKNRTSSKMGLFIDMEFLLLEGFWRRTALLDRNVEIWIKFICFFNFEFFANFNISRLNICSVLSSVIV